MMFMLGSLESVLLVLIELFWIGVTAEAIRAKTDRKLAGESVSAKFSRRRGRPHQSFLHR